MVMTLIIRFGDDYISAGNGRNTKMQEMAKIQFIQNKPMTLLL
jgi:hypothetical protein